MVSDDLIMDEAIRLVDEGVEVTFPVNGRSMLPFIVGGRDSVVLIKPSALKRGDVILARVENGHFVIHRIVDIAGENVTLMGDGNLCLREHCKVNDVRAKVTHVVCGKKRISLESRRQQVKAKIWFWLLPVRRWLLAIYRRLV